MYQSQDSKISLRLSNIFTFLHNEFNFLKRKIVSLDYCYYGYYYNVIVSLYKVAVA